MKKNHLKLSFFAVTLIILVSHSVFAKMHIVKVGDGGAKFNPSSITTVVVGDIVRFEYVSGFHTTTSTTIPAGALSWDANMAANGDAFDYEVKVAGKYNYVCSPHAPGMAGSFTATNAVGIEQVDYKASFSIYPQPANNILNLNVSHTAAEKLGVKIYDISGRQMQKEEILVNGNTCQVSIENLPGGMYFIELYQGAKRASTQRFIKE